MPVTAPRGGEAPSPPVQSSEGRPAPEARTMTPRILLRVTAPALLVGLVLVALSLGSAWSIHRLQGNLGSILTTNVASVQASLDLQNSLRKLRYQSLLYLVHPTPEVMAEVEAGESGFREA